MGIKDFWIKIKHPEWAAPPRQYHGMEEFEEVEVSNDEIDMLYNEGILTKEDRDEIKSARLKGNKASL